MPYVDGFLAAVPTANREAYKTHAANAWPIFKDLGAIALWECWGDDVPDGELTSYLKAVQAKEDETVVFSWTVWPDKDTRDAAWSKMMSDPAIGEAMGDMPFDGKRLIYGGFQPLMVAGEMPAV
ncbi:uncharacterized protein YbaA (DUF1428 family) [Aliiruegeria haliotis]|uniref:Uncharacterized protein YbaA (DUF1428 family) n=1 Tax=Aliiruegeria haliotis TaxID=1280846 RepID=A0A2T0RZD1_9RHOB|nr:DUF1428 domain-containing protein [Aliiruegeria haliotis]PRY26541.1 uncharacterized protein YbaA (DUF1428 family) [Aliiruegeria haliotis]